MAGYKDIKEFCVDGSVWFEADVMDTENCQLVYFNIEGEGIGTTAIELTRDQAKRICQKVIQQINNANS